MVTTDLEPEQEDRRFFADNPNRQLYLRRARGWETSKGSDLTVVAQIRPGLRIRLPFHVHPLIDWSKLNQDEDRLRDALRASPMAGVLQAALGDL